MEQLEQSTWYRTWFNSELYSHIYSHRTYKEARQAAELFSRSTRLPTNANILDLCCGNGRLSRALADEGYNVVGLDLSETLLEQARNEGQFPNIHYAQGDMRGPYPFAPFDGIVNFFTSFGYFDEEADNFSVLVEVANSLRSGGYFFFDYFNADYLLSHLPPDDTRIISGRSITQRRFVTKDYVVKEITVEENGRKQEYSEQVRLYTPSDLQRMLESAGFSIVEMYGNYEGKPFLHSSERFIAIAQI